MTFKSSVISKQRLNLMLRFDIIFTKRRFYAVKNYNMKEFCDKCRAAWLRRWENKIRFDKGQTAQIKSIEFRKNF